MDIDSKERLSGKLKFLGFCAYGEANVYIFVKVDWLLGLLMLPLFARFASRYIVPIMFDDVAHWSRRLLYQKWNGAYYEFDGRQIRVEDFDGDTRQMPLIAVEDLENLFRDKARFRIKEGFVPTFGLLEGINSVGADKAAAWALIISRTAYPQADRARKLALFIERTFVNPKLKSDHLDARSTPNPELWGLKPRQNPDDGAKEGS